MKYTFILFSLVLIIGCRSTKTGYHINTLEESQSSDTFDIEKFKKRTNNFQYSDYLDTLSDDTIIRRMFFISDKTFIEREKPPLPNLFIIFRSFYPNGQLESKGLQFPDGFSKGIWYEYDEEGNLIEAKNHDEGYDFSFEKVLQFIKRKNLNIRHSHSHIGRGNGIWYIVSIDDREYPYTMRSIQLDGKTGKKLSDETEKIFTQPCH